MKPFLLSSLLVIGTLLTPPLPAGPAEQIREAGITGGLVVHLGCGNGGATPGLRVTPATLVHGLDKKPRAIKAARQKLRAANSYGPVSVEILRGDRLPYTDNLVNALVVDDPLGINRAEMIRVLRPLGLLLSKDGGTWKSWTKPWPDDIDDWTHYLHGPDNNAVAEDKKSGPPKRFQWTAGPRWARSHDHLASISAVVSARGRLFTIVDEAPTTAVAIEPDWQLVARDAFNGIVLWKQPIDLWEHHLRGFRSGPTELARRLVAVGDRVYVTLGYGKPVTALDAATGEVIRSYPGTDNTMEIIVDDGTLYLTVGDRPPDNIKTPDHSEKPANIWHWWSVYEETMPRKRVLAVDADSAKLLWKKDDGDTHELMPTTLAAADGRVFFQNHKELVALDARSGEVAWKAPRPVNRHRPSWSAPTLVATGGVVICADRAVDGPLESVDKSDKPSQWIVNSLGGQAPVGEMIAFHAGTGDQLWKATCKEVYNAPVDVFVSNEKVWSGVLVRKNEPGITRALDLRTGEEVFTRPNDQKSFPIIMGHHRCYRNKATTEYLVLGRDGIEFIDQQTGKGQGHAWVRGSCQYGVIPCNGLIYAPPHSCACHIESKLNSYNALAPAGSPREPTKTPRLLKGPAFGKANPPSAIRHPQSDSWPTYRSDAARSGRASTTVPTKLQQAWTADLGGPLTAPVIANGRCIVSRIDEQTVYALDSATGEFAWSHVAGGVVDSPPTIYEGMVYFGSADGRITCLKASDGAMAWQFRAGPEDRRIIDYGSLASSWPVHGSVLAKDGVVHAVAGRCAFLDGGIRLLRLEAATGKLLAETTLTENALPDVLSSDANSIYLRHRRFDLSGMPVKQPKPHLYSPAGFLDDTWWHRTYWQFGTQMGNAWGGWPSSGNKVPAGRILVVDDETVYGFGRLNQYHRDGSHVGLGQRQYLLYAAAKNTPVKRMDKTAKRPAPSTFRIDSEWSKKIDLIVRAMVLSGDILFVAGPPDHFVAAENSDRGPYFNPSPEATERQANAFTGAEGGSLLAVSSTDGEILASYPFNGLPAWDGLAAANQRLYLATRNGTLLCYRGKSAAR